MNTFYDVYDQVYDTNKVKNMNAKVFKIISSVHERRFPVQHESCESECGFNKSVYNANKKWNHDKCQCV